MYTSNHHKHNLYKRCFPGFKNSVMYFVNVLTGFPFVQESLSKTLAGLHTSVEILVKMTNSSNWFATFLNFEILLSFSLKVHKQKY